MIPCRGDPRARGIDILINNAGVGWCGPIGEMTGFPARLHGAAPRTFAVLADWLGDHG
jgi:NAD(P)-dependent dehydrogenase (short-subunit alcohol dehydrogenase family)